VPQVQLLVAILIDRVRICALQLQFGQTNDRTLHLLQVAYFTGIVRGRAVPTCTFMLDIGISVVAFQVEVTPTVMARIVSGLVRVIRKCVN
jgi:hypothetical protein